MPKPVKTVEEAYDAYCQLMPELASEAREVAERGSVHEVVIITTKTAKRGLVTEMSSRELSERQKHGRRYIDLE